MSQSDPTDNVLAAIASILEQPDSNRDVEKAAPEPEEAPAPPPLPPIDGAGYSRTGPGPIAAIRFKWTVREEHGAYYVDETIGENSTPVVSGPMTKDAAIQLVDDRESEARHRFEQIKGEMTGRAAAANLVRRDSSEI